MNIPDIIIAIDGFSSTGKSSFAKLIAREFGFRYLDSGALYRGVTLYAVEHGLIGDDGVIDTKALGEALPGIDLNFRSGKDGSKTYLGSRCIEKERVVIDGRDIGVTVFPDAELKIFMTAAPEVRAMRRMKEMQGKGEDVKFEDVLENVKERDYIDSHREVSPLAKADDAVVLDNSDMTLEEQMVWVKKLIAERFGDD